MNNSSSLVEDKVSVKIRLALFWTTLMCLYIYADYFELMTPGRIERMISLQTPVGPTSPGLLIVFSLLLIVPALMIAGSLILPSRFNRWMNIAFAVFYACISVLIIINGLGSEWQTFFVLYNIVELLVLTLIIWHAWCWPKEMK